MYRFSLKQKEIPKEKRHYFLPLISTKIPMHKSPNKNKFNVVMMWKASRKATPIITKPAKNPHLEPFLYKTFRSVNLGYFFLLKR